jgi:hypothetical protein
VFILVIIVGFGVLWSLWAHRAAWALFRAVVPARSGSLKFAWYWGLTLVTVGLLAGFAALGLSLPPLLQHLFSNSSEVSVSMIALAIVIVLGLSWLVSLNRYRVCIEDFYAAAPEQKRSSV